MTVPIVITMEPVEGSSNLADRGYDPRTRILVLRFRDGALYRYFDVDPLTWRDFLDAPSAGQFFHQRIKLGHDAERMNP